MLPHHASVPPLRRSYQIPPMFFQNNIQCQGGIRQVPLYPPHGPYDYAFVLQSSQGLSILLCYPRIAKPWTNTSPSPSRRGSFVPSPLRQGPGSSLWARKLVPCIDYRGLNNITMKNWYWNWLLLSNFSKEPSYLPWTCTTCTPLSGFKSVTSGPRCLPGSH